MSSSSPRLGSGAENQQAEDATVVSIRRNLDNDERDYNVDMDVYRDVDVDDDDMQNDDDLVPVRERNQDRFIWRVVLGSTSALVAAVSIPMIIAVNPLSSLFGVASSEHLTRDGALGLIAATAGGLTAWRPRWAAAMMACCFAVLALQLVGGLNDGHDDGVTVRFEAIHLAVLLIAALVAFGARRRQYVPAARHH